MRVAPPLAPIPIVLPSLKVIQRKRTYPLGLFAGGSNGWVTYHRYMQAVAKKRARPAKKCWGKPDMRGLVGPSFDHHDIKLKPESFADVASSAPDGKKP
jgi:hypothetical protein